MRYSIGAAHQADRGEIVESSPNTLSLCAPIAGSMYKSASIAIDAINPASIALLIELCRIISVRFFGNSQADEPDHLLFPQPQGALTKIDTRQRYRD